MGKCKGCGKPVHDGEEYCSECIIKKKADESYLDSLLSSVVVPVSEKRERPMVKSTAKPINVHTKSPIINEKKKNTEELSLFEEISAEDIPDYNILDDSDDSYLNEIFPSTDVNMDLNLEGLPEEGVEESQVTEEAEGFKLEIQDSKEAEGFELEIQDLKEAEDYDELETQDSKETNDYDKRETWDIEEGVTEEPIKLKEAEETIDSEETVKSEEFDEPEPQEMELLNDLLRSVGEETEIPDTEPLVPETLPQETQSIVSEADESQEEETEAGSKVSIIESDETDSEEDILDFWNSINVDGMDEKDVNGEDVKAGLKSAEEPPIKAFDQVDDSEEDYLNMIPNQLIEEADNSVEEQEILTAKKKKKGLFSRIFGNIKEDISEEELENRKKAALEKFEEDEKKAIEKVELDKTKKQEKEEKNKEVQAQKAEQVKEKKEKQKLQAEQKKELKDKREIARKALLDEIEQNEGKINKVGASFVFVVFAAILCFITIGTSIYTYRVAIENATFDFDLKRYQDAYDDVYGLRIKEEDQELYDKIMTVQFVNTQLISYLKYTAIDQDAEALDSLMKGLRRYEKYIYYGTQLGIKDDLNYLKTQILTELDTTYHMTETDAYEMLAIEAQDVYSQAIYDKVSASN